MKFGAIFAMLFLLFAALAIPDCADAARMGGGKSFGSKPFMNNPTQAPAMRQQTGQRPGAAAAQASKPGLFGGMGGIFGGLLAGTLLGSLLSGGGFSGGGFMDIILLAVLAFIAWKLFSRFRSSRQEPAAQTAGATGAFSSQDPQAPFGQEQPMQRSDAGQQGGIWDKMRGLAGQAAPQAAEPSSGTSVDPAVDVPQGFDTEEFLRGAKMAYTRMQQAWDKRDLNDIAQFATPTVMRELKAQAANDPNPSQTEIMMVNAQVVGAEEEGENMRAQVYFDVLMREDPSQQTPENAREIWHFLRIGKNGNWKLDGIQQVD